MQSKQGEHHFTDTGGADTITTTTVAADRRALQANSKERKVPSQEEEKCREGTHNKKICVPRHGWLAVTHGCAPICSFVFHSKAFPSSFFFSSTFPAHSFHQRYFYHDHHSSSRQREGKESTDFWMQNRWDKLSACQACHYSFDKAYRNEPQSAPTFPLATRTSAHFQTGMSVSVPSASSWPQWLTWAEIFSLKAV